MAQPRIPDVSKPLGAPPTDDFALGQLGGSAIFVWRLSSAVIDTLREEACSLHVAAVVTSVWQRCLLWYYDALVAIQFRDVLVVRNRHPSVKVTLRYRDAVLAALSKATVPDDARAGTLRYVGAMEPLVQAWREHLAASSASAPRPAAHDVTVQADLCMGVLRLLALGLAEMRRAATAATAQEGATTTAADEDRLDDEWPSAAAQLDVIVLPRPVVKRPRPVSREDGATDVATVLLDSFPAPPSHVVIVLHLLLRHWLMAALLRMVHKSSSAAGGARADADSGAQGEEVADIVKWFMEDVRDALSQDGVSHFHTEPQLLAAVVRHILQLPPCVVAGNWTRAARTFAQSAFCTAICVCLQGKNPVHSQ